MNLIANSGIQMFTFPLEVDLNDTFKMYFHEWFDVQDMQLKLEIAHHFSEDGVWVRKVDLVNLGYTVQGKVGHVEDGNFKSYRWEEVKDDFHSDGNREINPMQNEDGGTDCFQMTVNRCHWDKLEDRWIPFPFFSVDNWGRSQFGPTNWCRFKLIRKSVEDTRIHYDLVLAFDTRTKYEEDGFEEEDLMEYPVFASKYDRSKDFAVCSDELALVSFCSKEPYHCDWIDEFVLDLFHRVKSIDDLKVRKPKLNYLAQFIFMMRYIQQANVVPKITLFSDRNVPYGDVDLAIDMGNSRTCGILFDNHDFTRVEALALQDLTQPVRDGELNRYADPFDMRLAFREADFGGSLPSGSRQFVYPSMVRLGNEANDLIHRAINLNTGIEKFTTFSSPKRYLWDDKPQQKEWEFITLPGERGRPIWIPGISEQINADGSFNAEGGGGIVNCYSRKALMTFSFLEIFAQAFLQINGYAFRKKWGEESKPRRLGRIIITCPTTMSRVEQIALRKCAEDAMVILDRFHKGTSTEEVEEYDLRRMVKIVPSVHNLLQTEERKEWIYDEATSAQFVYLFAEISKRYRNNCREYFDFYGKVRHDLGARNGKTLTVGSVDIGAGTTDVMIAAYTYDQSAQCSLTPIPLFWESIYKAGDDLLNALIRQLVIEGQHAALKRHFDRLGRTDFTKLALDFFGKDNARQSVTDRQVRSEFNIQVSVPVVSRYLTLLSEGKVEKATLGFEDIFSRNRPSASVLEHFSAKFGFSIEDMEWHYDKGVISKLVESTFDSLIGKISTVLSYYGCDIVLLTGRPASLKPISDLFVKYYAVSPNRLVTLNKYRIGTWYPFQDGEGYLKDAKSVVPVGAMIGNFAATRGSLEGFTLDLSELQKRLLPTTEYFSVSETAEPFITPTMQQARIEASQLPVRIWTRQLNSPAYPTRPFYILDLNDDKIEQWVMNRLDLEEDDRRQIQEAIDKEKERLRIVAPFKVRLVRENYQEDKESLRIESVEDKHNDSVQSSFFKLQIQSLGDGQNYWLDTGEFPNLSIGHQ